MEKSVKRISKFSAAGAVLLFALTVGACKDEKTAHREEPPTPRIERVADGILPPRGFPPHFPHESGEDEGKNRHPKVTSPERKMIFILMPPAPKDGDKDTSAEKLPSEQTIIY